MVLKKVLAAIGGITLTLPLGAATFQAGDGGWQLASPAIGNIDADNTLEIVVSYRNGNGQWVLDAYNPDGSRVAGFPYNAGGGVINVSPTLADLNGDGVNEILFTQGSSIVALRGNGAVFWKRDVTAANYIPDAGFHAITNAFYFSGNSLLQLTLPNTAEFFSEVSSPLVVDLEGDGNLEVLTAWKIKPDKLGVIQDYNPFINDYFGQGEWGLTGEVWSGGVIVSDAATGNKEMIYHFHQLVEAGLAVAQLDGDAALEVLVLNDADSIVAFDRTQPHGLFGSGMLHKKFGKNLRLLSGTYQRGVDVHAADIDGDGLDEVLVASSQISPNWQSSETLLDDDGSILWREWRPTATISHAHGWFNNAALIPVNPDHDNRADVLGFTHSHELTFRYWDGVQLVSHPGWPKNFAPYLPSPPAVADIDGDNVQEIIVALYDPAAGASSGRLSVLNLNGTERYAINITGGVKHIPAVADLDRDGKTEVVLRALDGKVHILSFGAGGNPNAVSWGSHGGDASHRGNFGRSLYVNGTPLVVTKKGGARRAIIQWQIPPGYNPDSIKIFRAPNPGSALVEVASREGTAREFIDRNLKFGELNVYEVRAVYGGTVVRSAPFSIMPDLENNMIGNGGFEADDDSHWDKWFTGEIPWANMTANTVNSAFGDKSMQIRLQNHGNNSSITQSSHYGAPQDYLPTSAGTLYSFGGFIRVEGINQSSEHWFEWDSSRTAQNTNARPSLPWPNYFTPSVKASANSTTPWLYVNRVFEMPAGFPNVELRHRYKVPAPASGVVQLDNIFFRSLPPATSSEWVLWIPFGSTWRYLASAPPENWYSPVFDDSSWSQGSAKFGAGGGPQNIVTPLPKNQPAYYFRKSFHAPAGAKEFLLAATCTDDYGGKTYPMRVWLNGFEIESAGIEAVTGDGNVVKYFDLAPFLQYLDAGVNTIAVMLNNTWQSTWDNVAFDVSLRAIPQPISLETKKHAASEPLKRN